MEIHVKIIGVLLMILASIHIIFPQYFNWGEELKSLNLINRQMMIIHTIFIALTVLLMGLLCFTSAPELLTTALGKKIVLGLGLFWTIRLFIQFFGYSSRLWKGKRFETAMHVLFSMLWTYFSAVFWVAYFD